MLWDYQGEWSEKIHNFQNSTVSNMEQFNDKLDKWIEDTTNELVEEAGNL